MTEFRLSLTKHYRQMFSGDAEGALTVKNMDPSASLTVTYSTQGDTDSIELPGQYDRVTVNLEGVDWVLVEASAYPAIVTLTTDSHPVAVEDGTADKNLAALATSAATQVDQTSPASVVSQFTGALSAGVAAPLSDSLSAVDTLHLAVWAAPSASGTLTIADGGGNTFDTFTLIAGLLNFVTIFPRRLNLKASGVPNITASVACSVAFTAVGV